MVKSELEYRYQRKKKYGKKVSQSVRHKFSLISFKHQLHFKRYNESIFSSVL